MPTAPPIMIQLFSGIHAYRWYTADWQTRLSHQAPSPSYVQIFPGAPGICFGGSSWISCWISKSFNCVTWPRRRGDWRGPTGLDRDRDRPAGKIGWEFIIVRSGCFDHRTWLNLPAKHRISMDIMGLWPGLLVGGFKFVLQCAMMIPNDKLMFQGELKSGWSPITNQNTLGDTVNSHDWVF